MKIYTMYQWAGGTKKEFLRLNKGYFKGLAELFIVGKNKKPLPLRNFLKRKKNLKKLPQVLREMTKIETKKNEAKETREAGKEEKEGKWLIVTNRAAGLAQICHVDFFIAKRQERYFHFMPEGEGYKRKKQAEKALDKMERESIVWAVFQNVGKGLYFISKESDFSGNWRGSLYGFSNYVEDFPSREKALSEVKKRCKENENFTFCENNFHLC